MKKFLEIVALVLAGGDVLWVIINFFEDDLRVRLWACFIGLCIWALAFLCARWSERYGKPTRRRRRRSVSPPSGQTTPDYDPDLPAYLQR